MALLEAADLTLRYGGVTAVDKLCFRVEQGSLTALMGPNGAGKTSVFNCLTGFARQARGRVLFAGRPVLGRPPQQLTAWGLVRTFQNLRLFPGLTVAENVMAGAYSVSGQGLAGALLRTPAARREEAAIRRQAQCCMELTGVEALAERLPGELSYGEQRRVEWARALAARPRLLLLDEPAAGLNQQEKAGLRELIGRVREEMSLTILLIEHDIALVMGLADQVVAMDFGRRLCAGPPETVRRDPAVISSYLGHSPSENS